MKKIKALSIISIVLALGLVACGKTAGKDSGSGKTPGAPVDLVTFKNNVNGIESVTLEESIEANEVKQTSFGEGLGYIEQFSNTAISIKYEIDKDANVHAFSKMTMVTGYSHLTKLAETLGISMDALKQRLGSQVKSFDLEKDIAIAESYEGEGEEYSWYLASEGQRVEYDVDEEYAKYELEDEGDANVISDLKVALVKIADMGVLNRTNNTISVNSDAAKEIFGDSDFGSATLYIENNYPKEMVAELSGYNAKFILTDINKTNVTIPTGIEIVKCEHEYSHYYDELEDGHRLYCSNCYKYLAPKENHTLLESSNHLYCTVCRKQLSLVTAEDVRRVKIGEDEKESWGLIRQCTKNGTYYFEGFYTHGETKTIVSNSDLEIRYWIDYDLLFVRKQYEADDNHFANLIEPETLQYDCYKATRNTIEVFSGVSADTFPCLLDGTFQRSDYAEIKRVSKHICSIQAYIFSVSHTSSPAEYTVLDDCRTQITTHCSVCGAVTDSYVSSNHEYDYDNVKKVAIDDCHYKLLVECKKCHREDVTSYPSVSDHKNAKYTRVESAAYLKLKYDVDMNSNYVYFEMSCPTCNEISLYEFTSTSYMYHLEDKKPQARVYTLKNGKINRHSEYVNIPHITDEYGVCPICGKDKILIDLGDDVKFTLNFTLDSSNKVSYINIYSYTFAYEAEYNEVIEDHETGNNLYKTTYYKDAEKTQVICSIVTGQYSGQIVEIYRANGTLAYRAVQGEPLPKIK